MANCCLCGFWNSQGVKGQICGLAESWEAAASPLYVCMCVCVEMFVETRVGRSLSAETLWGDYFHCNSAKGGGEDRVSERESVLEQKTYPDAGCEIHERRQPLKTPSSHKFANRVSSMQNNHIRGHLWRKWRVKGEWRTETTKWKSLWIFFPP